MCEHNTTVTMFTKGYLTFEICTWGCGKILICEFDHTGMTRTLREIEHPELTALRARVEKLEAVGNKLVSLALSFNEDDPWIFERYDGVEIVSNAQNALRGEA